MIGKIQKKIYLSLLKKQLFEGENYDTQGLSNIDSSRKNKKAQAFLSEKNSNLYNLMPIEKKSKQLSKTNINNLENLIEYSEKTKNLITLQVNDLIPPFRKISRTPYKVLDAPSLRDDFYLHLLDWSKQDNLAVGLDKTVYLWDAKNSSVNQLCNLPNDQVCSLSWMKDGNLLAIGSSSGEICIYDVNKSTQILNFTDHTERVAVISNLNENVFSSGSQDFSIFNFDIREKKYVSSFKSHTQEVCGLKWSPDERYLASGGNDNKLMIWSLYKGGIMQKFNSHKSAVKAIGWSNHKFGLLASGGGTQDRTIKFWNINLLKMVDSIDTNSQVCNLIFSKNTSEFITTHGYSDNLIVLWKYPELEVVTTLKGHKDRVIYLSMSPDNNKIVTGAGDETVRFWEIFNVSDENSLEEKNKENKLFSLNVR